MKKVIVLLALVSLSLSQLFAQDPTFVKGDKVLNLGIGIGSAWYSGIGYHTQVPPVSASFEVGVADNVIEKGVIGVGGYLGYSSYKYTYSAADYGWKYSNLFIGARGNFHYPLADKLDTYIGLTIGVNVVSETTFGGYTGTSYGSYGGLRAAGYVGGRYYFKETFAVMAELGYGISYLNVGIALKF